MTLNKVMLIGNLGRDPEIRHTKNGDPVANFALATTEQWKDRQGQRQERTEWHRCVAWRHLAEFAQNCLHKGIKIYVEGRLETRDWTDNDNIRRFRTEVIVNNIQFLTSRSESAAVRNQDTATGSSSPSKETGDNVPSPESTSKDNEAAPYVDDDIPF